MLGGDRLGEGAVERRHVGQLDPSRMPRSREERVGEEHELERRHRALDRHLDDVQDELAAFPGFELRLQCLGAVDGVEVEHRLVPLVIAEPGRLSGGRVGAGSDDQVVVREFGAVDQLDLVLLGLDEIDLAHHQLDARRDEATLWLLELLALVATKREEQEPGLVVVGLVLIDERDLPFSLVEYGAEFVGHHGSGGSRSEY